MVTVALEMPITMRRGGCPQAASACCPLSLSTGTDHPVPHLLLYLHLPHHPCLCVHWGRDSGCPHPFPGELMADDGSGGAGCQWELWARQEWAISRMSCLSWMGCTPPVSWPGKLQPEIAEEISKFLNISQIKYHVLQLKGKKNPPCPLGINIWWQVIRTMSGIPNVSWGVCSPGFKK